MLSEFENEQDTLEISMENAKAEIEKYESDTIRADKFIELVKRYTDFSELTTPMLNEFVEAPLFSPYPPAYTHNSQSDFFHHRKRQAVHAPTG